MRRASVDLEMRIMNVRAIAERQMGCTCAELWLCPYWAMHAPECPRWRSRWSALSDALQVTLDTLRWVSRVARRRGHRRAS